MDITEATSMARGAMNDHGLGHWIFQLDRSKRRFGQSRPASRTISMSEHLIRLNDRATVLDVVLHEIAHALVGGGHGHDHVWKAKCREVGANPERCYDSAEVATPPGAWLAVCENCGPTGSRHRRPKNMAGWTHNRCGKGAITWRENREGWTPHKAAQAVAASEPSSDGTVRSPKARPTLDADAQARVDARAAARAADIKSRLGI